MKKALLTLTAVGLMATAANAALIGAKWAGHDDQKNFGNGTVEVWLQLFDLPLAGGGTEGTAGLFFEFATTNAPNLSIGNFQTGLGGQWNAGGIPGDLSTGSGTQFVVSTPNAGDNLVNPGAYLMGTFDVTISGPLDDSTKQIFLGAHITGNGVFDTAGTRMAWDSRYATLGSSTGYGGYVAYMNWGNPGWGNTTMGQPTPNPLLITKTPEPTSLALVALGGFALLRRRR